MNTTTHTKPAREAHYAQAASWAHDRDMARLRSVRIAWLAAAIAIGIAMLEAVALALMAPLKTIVPYTFLVDRNTGYVQTLKGSATDRIIADEALRQSLLAQYVIAREGFDIALVRTNFRKVALWSGEPVRGRYLSMMQGSNPASPLLRFPRKTILEVRIRSVSFIGPDTALVRFETERHDQNRDAGVRQAFVSIVRFRFSNAEMSIEDRYINPLGFQVVQYRRDQETAENVPDWETSANRSPGERTIEAVDPGLE